MTFSPSAGPQQATRTKQHQMSVTHRTLGLHSRATPGAVRGLERRPAGVGPSEQGLKSVPAARNGTRGTSWEPTRRRCAGKGLSMRSFRAVPIARGFTRQQCVPDTVEAEKGSLWTNREAIESET